MGSVIDRAAIKAGIELDRDVPGPKNRRVRDWAKLIGIARKLESQDSEAIEQERRKAAEFAAKNASLLEENFALREQLRKLVLQERCRQIELSPEAQRVLLAPPGAEEKAA